MHGFLSSKMWLNRSINKPTSPSMYYFLFQTDEDLLEEEMRRTVEAPDIPRSPVGNKDIGNDTMFEEPISGVCPDEHFTLHMLYAFCICILLFSDSVTVQHIKWHCV